MLPEEQILFFKSRPLFRRVLSPMEENKKLQKLFPLVKIKKNLIHLKLYIYGKRFQKDVTVSNYITSEILISISAPDKKGNRDNLGIISHSSP